MIEELHPDQIEAVLHRYHVGRLAFVVEGRAQVVPITYAYADGTTYGQILPGRKLAAMRAVNGSSLGSDWWSQLAVCGNGSGPSSSQ